MVDMLVRLYTLPEVATLSADLKRKDIEIRQGHPAEKHIIADWVRQHFQDSWAVGCEVGLEQRPVSCYIAIKKTEGNAQGDNPYDLPPEILLGFACYDVASKGMFGPIGVREDYRGQGIGKALLLTCLHAMVTQGYAYAVIGWAGSTEFYATTVGATIIEDSEPGIFRGGLTG